jgi:hypothetical protein
MCNERTVSALTSGSVFRERRLHRHASIDRRRRALQQLPPHILEQIRLESPARWRDDTALKMTFETDDLDAKRRAILAHGGAAATF